MLEIMRNHPILLLSPILLAGCAASDLPRTYVAGTVKVPPVIDGSLDDPAWRDAPWTADFQDIEGDSMPTPRFRTRAKMVWDDEMFYVAAWMEEPDVWGTLQDRDSIIYNDNDFEVFIDPDGDSHDYYELEVNALNTQFDLMLTRPYRCGGTYDIGWDIDGLLTAVDVDGTLNIPDEQDEAWTMEIAIPWASLASHANRAVPPLDGDQWRVNFSRVQWQHILVEGGYARKPGLREDNWVWSQQGAIDMHRPQYWGRVMFVEDPPGVRSYVPAGDEAARTSLRRAHEAVLAYSAANGTLPGSMEDLDGLWDPVHAPGLLDPVFKADADGWVLEVSCQVDGEVSKSWSIGPSCKVIESK
ncbi:MAG: hypothetical protein CMJ24_08110 [Phycisphaerae bacterium]|nr:hypothetical protein [Phycisphaerae bacterium]